MKFRKLLVVAIAGAFALPFAAQVSAAGDRFILAADGPSGSSSTGTGPTGGVASPRSAGEPKAATDKSADTRRCEAMTGVERETCMRDASAPRGAASGATGSSTGTSSSATGGATSSSGAPVTSGGSGVTGTTGAPDRTAPGSATATKPDTSGTGKAQ